MKKLLIFFAFLVAPVSTWAANATPFYVGGAGGTQSAPTLVTPLTYSFTSGTYTTSVLIVYVTFQGSGAGVSVTGVSWNSQSFTLSTTASDADNAKFYAFYLLNPTASTMANVTVGFGGTGQAGSSLIVQYANADPVNPVKSVAVSAGQSASISLTQSLTSGSLLSNMAAQLNGGVSKSLSNDGRFTQRQTAQVSFAGGNAETRGCDVPISNTASYTWLTSITGGGGASDWFMAGLELQPVVGSPTFTTTGTSTPTPTLTATGTVTATPSKTGTSTITTTTTPTPTPTVTVTKTITPTSTPWPTPCQSPIHLENWASFVTTPSSSLSFNFTFSTTGAPNSVIVGGAYLNQPGSNFGVQIKSSWGGVDAVQITRTAYDSTRVESAWSITNPALSTSNTVNVTVTGTSSNSGLVAWIAQYSNVAASNVIGAIAVWAADAAHGGGPGNPIHTTITPQTFNSLIVGQFQASGTTAVVTPSIASNSGQHVLLNTIVNAAGTPTLPVFQYFDKQSGDTIAQNLSSTVLTIPTPWSQILFEIQPLSCNTATNTTTPTMTSTVTPTLTASPTPTTTPTSTVTSTPWPTPCNSPVIYIGGNGINVVVTHQTTPGPPITSFSLTYTTDASPFSALLLGIRSTIAGAGALVPTSTSFKRVTGIAQTSSQNISMWALTNSAASASYTFGFTDPGLGQIDAHYELFVAQYANVDSFTPLGSANAATGTADPISCTLTTSMPNSMIVGYSGASSVSATAGEVYHSGQTTRWSSAAGSGAANIQFFDLSAQGAAAYTISSTSATNTNWGQVLVEAEPLNCITPSPTFTRTRTATKTATPTLTNTATNSPTTTYTITPSATPSATVTPTTTPVCGTYGDTNSESFAYYGAPMWSGNEYSLPAGRVNFYALYVNLAGSRLQMALYADAGGRPGALVAKSSIAMATEGWNYLAGSGATFSAGNYWLLFQASDTTSRIWGREGANMFIQRCSVSSGCQFVTPPSTLSGIIYANKYTFASYVDVCNF